MSEIKSDAGPGNEGSGEVKFAKEITNFGFFGLCLSAIFGSSWLLTSGAWLDRAGGPVNALIAFILCVLVELPLVLAYVELTPMMPLAGGEMCYSYLTLGSFAGFFVGWFYVLACVILCMWEALAITRCLTTLFPQLAEWGVLYEVLGSPVSVVSIVIGLLLIVICGWFAIRGAKGEANFGLGITLTVNAIALICVIVAIVNFDPANMQPLQSKGTVVGSISLLAMLPFSVAGWDVVTKGAAEAAPNIPLARIPKFVIAALIVAVTMYILTWWAPTGLVPWQELTEQTAPFAYAMAKIGLPVLGSLLLAAATIGCIGVYNAVLFAGARALYQMGDIGLISKKMGELDPKYHTPKNAILLISALSVVAVLLGQGMFIPLIDVAAFSYILYWGFNLVALIVARKKYPDAVRPAMYPGGKPLMYVGIVIAVILGAMMLIPGTPASIAWPVEYITLAALVAIGFVLYAIRDKSTPKGSSEARLWEEIRENQTLREEQQAAMAARAKATE